MTKIRSRAKPMSIKSLAAWIVFTSFIVSSILVISIGVMPPNFNDELYLLNNDFDLNLRSHNNSLGSYLDCENTTHTYENRNRKVYEPKLEEVFLKFIPKVTQIKKAIEALEIEAGGSCSTRSLDESQTTETICIFNKQRVYGYKTLSLKGWKIAHAIKSTSKFQYVIQAKNESMIDIKAKLLCGESYKINPSLYETSKIIQRA